MDSLVVVDGDAGGQCGRFHAVEVYFRSARLASVFRLGCSCCRGELRGRRRCSQLSALTCVPSALQAGCSECAAINIDELEGERDLGRSLFRSGPLAPWPGQTAGCAAGATAYDMPVGRGMRRIDPLRPLAGATAAVALVLVVVAGAGGTVSSGAAWTVAGNGMSGNTGDGDQATEAEIDRPRSIFATADGGFVWAQPWSNRVRKVGPDGVISTVAGTGAAGFSGDGGPATAATLNFVHSAAPTVDGGLLLADELNNRIRKISAGGVISTVAGTGGQGYSGDGGPATAAEINNPRGVVGLADGGFLIPDSNNHRVRRVSPERRHHHGRRHRSSGLQRRRRAGDRGATFGSVRRGADCRRRLPHCRRRQSADSQGLR